MGATSRRKGAAGEREVCALLSAEFGEKITRNIGQARDGGDDITLPPFAIECKRRAKIAGLYDWIEQAELATHFGKRARVPTPVVMCRADGRTTWLVVMRFADWAKLAREEIAAARIEP